MYIYQSIFMGLKFHKTTIYGLFSNQPSHYLFCVKAEEFTLTNYFALFFFCCSKSKYLQMNTDRRRQRQQKKKKIIWLKQMWNIQSSWTKIERKNTIFTLCLGLLLRWTSQAKTYKTYDLFALKRVYYFFFLFFVCTRFIERRSHSVEHIIYCDFPLYFRFGDTFRSHFLAWNRHDFNADFIFYFVYLLWSHFST